MSKQTITSCDVCKRVDKPMRHAFGVDLCSYCEGNDTKVGALMDAFEKAEAAQKAKPLELQKALRGMGLYRDICRGCMTLSFDDQLHTCPRGQR